MTIRSTDRFTVYNLAMRPTNDLIYDWNRLDGTEIKFHRRPLVNDETLRDGLQSPSVLDPPVEKKVEILHLMEALGIDSLNLGLPGAGPPAAGGGLRVAPACSSSRLKITTVWPARRVDWGSRPIAAVSGSSAPELHAAWYRGSSPLASTTSAMGRMSDS